MTNKNSAEFSTKLPIKVGIVGTGYVAQRRAEALRSDDRAQLLCASGNTPENLIAFCETNSLSPVESWQKLVNQPDLDLVIISNINRDRAAIVRAVLESSKHAIVEYPLALNPTEAEELINLAKTKGKLLHVEHIELLGGLHQAMGQYLPEIGNVFYARYATIKSQRPAPLHWNYNYQMCGFPLTAALSRIHRFTDLFGTVTSVACQSRFWDAPESGYYIACLCNAQLRFNSGLIADITYGKGEVFWQNCRHFEIHGDRGTLIFEGEKGTLVREKEKIPLEVGSRRGLLAKDTKLVLDRLETGQPLYVTPTASLYALKVADAADRAARTGTIVKF
ncbi:MAG: Gfo/Idh/MocA family oxidoreductase [Prochloraceae cyanobacterium]|nr:Gfo/Idh/MocA family oxidoreductase [Prochloraceae cyanobacterium]